LHVSIDKTSVYNYCIRGIDSDSDKEWFRVAQQIEAMILDGGLTQGSAIATEAMLKLQLQTGHSVLRQAIRILESRYACRMRRGPGGGLFVTKPRREDAIEAIAGYLRSDGVEKSELLEALRELDGLAVQALSAQPCYSTDASPSDKRSIGKKPTGKRSADKNAAGKKSTGTKLSNSPTVGAIAMHSSNAVLSFFATAVNAATRLSTSDFIAAQDSAVCAVKPITSAARLADELGAEIQRQRGSLAEDIWLGTEIELCDRYAVSRAVLRQALCILEADGISTARRGRGGGVLARKPHPVRAIDIVAGYLSSDRSWQHDLIVVSQTLYEVSTRLACARWSEADDLRFRTLLKEGIPRFGGSATMTCFDIEWKATHNRALEFIMRALAAYNTRFLSAGFSASESIMQELHDSHLDRLRAIAERDAATAGQILAKRIALFEALNLMRV